MADDISTGAPTGFVVTGGAGQASGAVTTPNAANFGSAKVFRGTTANFAQATAILTYNGSPSQAFDFTDSGTGSGLAPGTYRY